MNVKLIFIGLKKTRAGKNTNEILKKLKNRIFFHFLQKPFKNV